MHYASQSGGVDLRRRQIGEARRIQDVQHPLPLDRGERARRRGPCRHPAHGPCAAWVMPIEGGRRDAERGTRRAHAEGGRVIVNGLHQRDSLGVSSVWPNTSATFFWRTTSPSARSARTVAFASWRSELRHPLGVRVDQRRRRPATLGRARQLPAALRGPPGREVRRVEIFAPEQRGEVAGLAAARGVTQDDPLIGGSESAAGWVG